jgi:hypothetical protein
VDEIVKQVSERTGIGADTVRTVLTSATDFVKERLPPQYAAQVEMFIRGAGGPGGPGSAGNAAVGNLISGMFGKEEPR